MRYAHYLGASVGNVLLLMLWLHLVILVLPLQNTLSGLYGLIIAACLWLMIWPVLVFCLLSWKKVLAVHICLATLLGLLLGVLS